jgi:MFS superfamily sulfate permease-like transporter
LAILYVVWILTFILFFPSILGLIPVCTFAAALVYTGGRLMNPKVGLGFLKQSRVEFAIYLSTALSIFMFGLLQGVLIGFTLAVIQVLYKLNHLRIDIKSDDEKVVVDLSGTATFLTIPKVSSAIEGIESQRDVHVKVTALTYIDHAIVDFLTTWEGDYVKQDGSVLVEWPER